MPVNREAEEDYQAAGFQQKFIVRSAHRLSYKNTGDTLTSRVIKFDNDADESELFYVQAYLGDSIGDYAMEFGPFQQEHVAYRFSVLLQQGIVQYHDSAPYGFEYFDNLGVNVSEEDEEERKVE